MGGGYSVRTCRELAGAFSRAELLRPLGVQGYDAGDILCYDVTGVSPARPAGVTLEVVKFVGGGFAGQVYKVKLLQIDAPAGPVDGLEVGGQYAVKILLPPTRFSRIFRDSIYRLGFQAPFQLQVNPAAARAGALWQKFIRRAAGVRFGPERAVVDIHATFVDARLGSCGEISEWVDGRVWRFEVNDRLDALKDWKRGRPVPPERAGSPEYRAKREFMAALVKLLREMGAPEFARQYEWWTCKSQPNALKRRDTESDPAVGLTAVDFRAGLALLPVLPMSPGDFKLILTGLARGSLVQFDRGSMGTLRRFTEAHAERFADMSDALAELAEAEAVYRNSQIDVTHNHVRLLTSPKLWSTICDSAVTGWRVRNVADEPCAARLRGSKVLTLIFAVLGLAKPASVYAALAVAIAAWAPAGVAAWLCGLGAVFAVLLPPLAAPVTVAVLAGGLWLGGVPPDVAGLCLLLAIPVPAVLGLLRRLWGRGDYRRHYGRMLTSGRYVLRALAGRRIEMLIRWHRAGRVGAERALRLADSPWRALAHMPLAILPASLHRLVTDGQFARERLAYIFVRPIRLYFSADAREQWLRDMVAEGQRNHMLTDDDAERILSRIKEPFIQKYLKSLAVHVCTLPVTQVVSVVVAIWYVMSRPDLSLSSWADAKVALAYAGGILLAFQLTPISPGSLARGLYVLYVVIRERNFKDYNIAVFLGFFKYIGYLSFPIQMAYRYPALARFMASHWATGAVHVVPVFGERGALLEHAVFNLFYNRPLTTRRRMRQRDEARASEPARSWHAPVAAVVAVAALAAVDFLWIQRTGGAPILRRIWWAMLFVPAACGIAVTAFAGSASLKRRVALALAAGIAVGFGYTAAHAGMLYYAESIGGPEMTRDFWRLFGHIFLWRLFAGMLCCVVAALGWEVFGPAGRSGDRQAQP